MKNSLHDSLLYQNKHARTAVKIIDLILKFFPKKKRSFPAVIKSILIFKPDHLGDVLLATGAISALKSYYPAATIDVVIGPWSQGILAKNPHIRNIFSVRHYMHHRSERSRYKKILSFMRDLFYLISALRPNRYDVIINLRPFGGNLLSITPLIHHKWLISHGTSGFTHFIDAQPNWNEGQHEVEHFAEVLNLLKIPFNLSTFHYEIYPSEDDLKKVQKFINEDILVKDFVCIHPGSGNIKKSLPISKWIEIVSQTDKKIVVCGLKEETEVYNQLAKEFPDKIINACSRFSITQIFNLFEQASEVHTLDSLAGHLAAASKSQAFVYFRSASDPEQWRPLGENVKIIEVP